MDEIRDRRTQRYWTADNVIIDVYGPQIGIAGLAVYACLCRHASRDETCFPGKRLLMQECGVKTEGPVDRGLSALVKADLIKIEPRYREDGSRTTNLYVLLTPPCLREQENDTPAGAISRTPPGVISHTPPGVQKQGDGLNNPHLTNPIEQEEDSSEGADAPVQASDPSTYQEWAAMLEHPRQYRSNRIAILRRMFERLYPRKELPTYAYLGRVAQNVGGAGRLAELLWQHSTRPPTGDVLRYVQGVTKSGDGHNGKGSRQNADTTTDFEALGYANLRALEAMEEAQRERARSSANG